MGTIMQARSNAALKVVIHLVTPVRIELRYLVARLPAPFLVVLLALGAGQRHTFLDTRRPVVSSMLDVHSEETPSQPLSVDPVFGSNRVEDQRRRQCRAEFWQTGVLLVVAVVGVKMSVMVAADGRASPLARREGGSQGPCGRRP